MNEIIEGYQWRKERLGYDYSALVQPYASPYKTSLDFTINVPKSQQVAYIPGILQTLKFAWLQYVSLLIPSLLIFFWVVGFLLRHQIVATSVTSDLVQRRRF